MNGAGVAAAVLAGVALALLGPLPAHLPPGLAPARGRWVPGPVQFAVGGAVVTVVVLGTALGVRQLVLALVFLAVGLGVVRLVRQARRAASATRRAGQVLAACDSIAADLVAGQPPLAALERAGAEWVELGPAVAAARLGADVPLALRDLSGHPGGSDLRVLAAAWQVAHESGCGLADAVRTAADGIRERQATSRLVSTELAAAHATARLMALLPVGVLLLGAGVGGDPVGFLTGTVPGLGCLAGGLGLAYAGLAWLHGIGDRVLVR